MPTQGSETERIEKTVQMTAELFSVGIAQHPEDWHMLQRIWVDARDEKTEGSN